MMTNIWVAKDATTIMPTTTPAARRTPTPLF